MSKLHLHLGEQFGHDCNWLSCKILAYFGEHALYDENKNVLIAGLDKGKLERFLARRQKTQRKQRERNKQG